MFPQPPFPLKREPTASAPRGDTLSTRIDCYRSLFMSLVRGRKESKLVRSLVLYVKLGVRFLAAVAARVPSLKLHIPFIRTLRISVRSGVGVPPKTATELQYHLRKAQISLLPKATISRTLCVHFTYIAVAARVPSSKLHIPCIRTLRICIRSGVGVPPFCHCERKRGNLAKRNAHA